MSNFNLLFVCTGNTCRSPMAEVLMRSKLEQASLNISIQSAGISATSGSPASIGTRNVLLAHGIDANNFRSQQLERKHIEESHYVFCMSRTHRDAIVSQMPQTREKVLLLGDFLDGDTPVDIADPYGLDQSAYQEVESQVLVAIANILQLIKDNKDLQDSLSQ